MFGQTHSNDAALTLGSIEVESVCFGLPVETKGFDGVVMFTDENFFVFL